MEKWARLNYQPCLPLGDHHSAITGCQSHIDLSRKAAGEGIVLLKNDGVLPLRSGTRIAVFGNAQIDYVKGGGGSGDVYCRYVRNIYEGLKQKQVELFHPLSLYYQAQVEQAYAAGGLNGRLTESEIPQELLEQARAFTDTAILTVNRYSGEGWDRKNDGEDLYFDLNPMEKKMVSTVCSRFEKVILLLNTGAMIDTGWFAENDRISAALMIWQGGMEGGLAAADVLVGDVNPSGKLVDTCAGKFEDYPSSAGFHESDDYVKYTEDVFVGYRYFETIPGKKDCVVYPFGYGLSYTEFSFANQTAQRCGERILVSVDVTNIGSYPGKEVVQAYFEAPAGRISKPARVLCAFGKTGELKPGETQTLSLSFRIDDMASYDDLGAVQKSAYVLEQGEYRLYAGNSVRNVQELDYRYLQQEDRVVCQLTEYCRPRNLGKRLLADGSYLEVPDCETEQKVFSGDYHNVEKTPASSEDIHPLADVAKGKITLDEFISQLSDEELMHILTGAPSTGVANTDGMGGLPKYGIPAAMTVDGPAGVRVDLPTGVRTTAFPVATMLACTWNTELMEQIGAAGALEVKENNMAVWLTPALNIHRSPLCGRNFEYYSEDPFVAGKMAAAMVRGIQSQGIVATPKHFACNNKETNRQESDSIVSERALREIYLKGFEICVRESGPRLLMTAYNKLNGVRTSENAELITGILRGEWGYQGLVTTDWWNTACKTPETLAGNDIRMPSTLSIDPVKDIRIPAPRHIDGVTRDQVAVCAKRLLEMLLWLE